MPLTQAELNEIKERAEKAVSGPWSVDVQTESCDQYGEIYEIVQSDVFLAPVVAESNSEADAEFIAHAREDIPKLVAEVERLKSAIAEAISDIETISPHEAKKTLLEALENGD